MHAVRRSARRARALLPAALLAAAGACAGAPAPADGPAPAPATGGALPLKLDPRPTSAALTAADLMTRLYVFADDSMLGRQGGTIGNVKGTDYLAREAARMGLQPAGENGTFFQTIPLVNYGLTATSGLSQDGRALAMGTEMLPLPSYEGLWTFGTELNAAGVPVVYGGRLGETLLPPAQAAGKIVVFAPKLNGGQPSYRFWMDAPLADYASAAAVIFPTLEISSASLRAYGAEPAVMLATGRAAPRAPVGVLVSAAAADAMFGAPLASLRPGAAGRGLTGTIRFAETPAAAPARNVVAVLPGSDPALRGQYVAIGAHNDHEGVLHGPAIDHDSVRIYNAVLRPQGLEGTSATPSAAQRTLLRAAMDSVRRLRPARLDSVYNGADDDGSGSVAVLEIAQAMAAMNPRPRRSVVFVWHTGEELGLLGSEFFARHPTISRDSIVAQLNIDMIGRGNADDMPAKTKTGAPVWGGPDYLQLVGSRRLSTQLGDIVERVNRDGGHNLRFDYSNDADGHEANIYCRSDHYNYARFGIPVTFFTTGIHRDYHQVSDEPQYINYEKMARIASLIRDVAVDVANRDARIVVDKPKPNPEGDCQQ